MHRNIIIKSPNTVSEILQFIEHLESNANLIAKNDNIIPNSLKALANLNKARTKDQTLQFYNCLLLTALCQTIKSSTLKIVQAGGIPILLQTIRQNVHCFPIQEHGCTVLHLICNNKKDELAIKVASSADIISILIEVMKQHLNGIKITRDVRYEVIKSNIHVLCSLLNVVCDVTDETHSDIVKNNGIFVINKLMERYFDDAFVNEKLCDVLVNLVGHNYLEIIRCGGIKNILNAMVVFTAKKNQRSQFRACLLLNSLLVDESSRVKFIESRGISTLLETIKQNMNYFSLQNYAWSTLKMIFVNDEYANEFASSDDSISLLIQSTKLCVDNNPSENLSEMDMKSHIYNLCDILYKVCHRTRSDIVKNDGILVINKVMQRYFDDSIIIYQLCFVLANLVKYFYVEIVRSGGIKNILNAMQTHWNIREILMYSWHILALLSCDYSYRIEIKRVGGVQVILDSLEIHLDDRKSQDNLKTVAKNFSIVYSHKIGQWIQTSTTTMDTNRDYRVM